MTTCVLRYDMGQRVIETGRTTMTTRKIHLRRNKAENGQLPIAICATRPEVRANGYMPRNQRSSYQFMASEIVAADVFRATPIEKRCVHCLEAGLIMLNRLRSEKGKEPVKHFDDVAPRT